ncbi:MAG: hypothetical protein VB104_09130 [Candidatus Limiplasma sp.]|nr:hypothetical protein [Candidatus Limiplasma sp.]
MSPISVSPQILLIKGIPECLVVAWAIHIFTRTPLEWKKYLFLAGVYILSTYLIRFLPITLGVNTVLSLFVLIFAYQIIYHAELSKVIRAVISSVVVLILSALSELLNVLLLSLLYGQEQANQMFRFSDEMTRALCSIPSNVFLFLFALAGYFLLKRFPPKPKREAKTVDPAEDPDSLDDL